QTNSRLYPHCFAFTQEHFLWEWKFFYSGVAKHLALNPSIGFQQSVLQSNGWFPLQILSDFGVVAVTAVYALRSVQFVNPLHPDPRDFFNQIDQFVNAHHFATSKI